MTAAISPAVERALKNPKFIRKLSFLLLEDARYKIAYGGRGSAKSWQFARALLLKGAVKPLRILCARELQNSIKDSVHKLLCDQIVDLGLEKEYEVGDSYIRSRCGTDFIFKGLRSNAREIKSMEGIDICWVEEAQSVSETSWTLLIPTIRKPGSEIWISFNPDQETDPTYRRFVTNLPPRSIRVNINYWDNPFFSDVLREEMEYDKKNDTDLYMHVWEGHCWHSSDAQVLAKKWRTGLFERPSIATPYYGADWGFAVDPTVLTSSFIHDNRLFIEYEAWAVKCDLDDLPELFDKVPGSRDYIIRADSARPETISHMRKKKFKIEGAKKWDGSVKDGIGYLRKFKEIVIHERCKHTRIEAKLYSYERDRLTNDVLPKLIDKHNHCWDSVRYAHTPMIMNRGSYIA